MIEGAVQLNRFGLERRRTWPAVALAIAVFLPALFWTQWNKAVPGEAEVAPGTVLTLSATGPPETGSFGRIRLTIPADGSGWRTATGRNRQSTVVLVHGSVWLETHAMAGVDDFGVLFDRQSRDLGNEDPAMFTTGKERYTSPTGLTGYRGTLTGERYGGTLYVLGRGDVAAVVVTRAPLGRLDGEALTIEQILATLEVV
ncbi:hypothetical protein [Stackebrandtia albiflava]|uniref:hypothetical protein n=1 Tax=Stackebrandtia albiflava TaxID=406432 RepID=UPI0011BFBEC2|nr:hypothetical protein [Stackebrandtia albiflava]